MSNITYSLLNVFLYVIGIKLLSSIIEIEIPDFLIGWCAAGIFMLLMDLLEKKSSTRDTPDNKT